MTTAYTSLLGLALPVTGELSGTWGDTVNTAITSLLDSAVAGTTSITVDSDITLSTTTGASNEARQAIILWNPASGTVTRNITAPAQSKIYTVINASGGTQSIVIRGVGPTTGVTVIKGESAQVAWNGSDFVKISSSAGDVTVRNLTVTGTLAVTGATTLSSALTYGGVTLSNSVTGTGSMVLSTSPTLVTPALGTPASGVVTNLTGTASININGTVGATTASTGAFTTLTTSSTVTLNGGTANGVTYLNGSKVLTSGSALTFDGTSLGVGTSSLVTKFQIQDSERLEFGGASGVMYSQAVNAARSATVEQRAYGSFLSWWTGAAGSQAEQMRLTSTGLGIGTSSPGAKLDVVATASRAALFRTNQTFSGFEFNDSGTSTNPGIFGNGNAITFWAGAAERMRLDSSGNLGIGTSSPAAKLEVSTSTSTEIRSTTTGSAGNVARFRLKSPVSDYAWYVADNINALVAYDYNAGAERMRIDSSGNLGIGTSSPSARLTLKAGSNVSALRLLQDNNEAFGYSLQTDSSTGNFIFNRYASSDSALYTISTSGNLGLGVTPSAWSGYKVLQAGIGSFVGGSSGAYLLQDNAYTDNGGSSWKYINSSYAAAQYYAASGAHVWRTAPSGTAGNAISFTQAMTLDASGNWSLGLTSSYGRATIKGTTSNSSANALYVVNSGESELLAVRNDGQIQMGVNQKLTLDSSGNLGVGTTSLNRGSRSKTITLEGSSSEAYELVTNGTYMGYFAAGGSTVAVGSAASVPLVFQTVDTERARIDTSGNLLVRTTSEINSYTAVQVFGTGGSNDCFAVKNTNTTNLSAFSCWNSSGSYVGGIVAGNTSTSFPTSSDYRLKENIAPMTGALAKVAALKPVTYTWKLDGSAGEGFIAHELAEVCPAAVIGEKDAVDAEGNPQYQGIDVSFLVGTLTAAIQELKAEFDAYKASHP